MTNEELCKRIQEGETELIPTLWEQCEKFIKLQADRRFNHVLGHVSADVEDLYQSGYFALLEAMQTYTETDGGRSFIGWLDYSLRTQFAEVLGYRTQKQKMAIERRAISIDGERESKKDGEIFTLEAFIPDPAQELELEEVLERDRQQRIKEYVYGKVNGLPGDCQYITLNMLENDLSASKTADRLDMDRSKVRNIYVKSLNILKNRVRTDRKMLQDMDLWQARAWGGSGLEAWKKYNESSVERAVFLKEKMAEEMEYIDRRIAELEAEKQRYLPTGTSRNDL